ncbi:GDSL-type esterase/lipase family protein [Streptomyces melanogenes]|uniref:GDSL-type esterase/lipase family protein n=1 Tax=Streptomyces melanogenes TaxID=67326 RepID=A0ABZ1XFB7_9ACTN|nr:GDSL-type esterase/lipase family protein [Streptomyces melanogenes]
MNWLDPEPFLRGVAWRGTSGRPLRADPAQLGRLPLDVVERAALPVGVRLEFLAEGASAVEIRYRAEVPAPSEPLAPLAHTFALWTSERRVAETTVPPAGEAVARLQLRPCGGPFTVHPPQAVAPRILALRGIGGSLRPVPAGPRWLVHGDSITEGWWSTRPAHAWPAVAGRALGLDTVNLGYAGSARGELATAEQLASLPADVLTLAFGTNCWSGVPSSAPLLYETTRAFLALVRRGHPHTPLLLLSPLLHPTAERTPNALGATLSALRAAMEAAARDRVTGGDNHLHVLPGRDLLTPTDLADGLHPNDGGHRKIAEAVAKALAPHI